MSECERGARLHSGAGLDPENYLPGRRAWGVTIIISGSAARPVGARRCWGGCWGVRWLGDQWVGSIISGNVPRRQPRTACFFLVGLLLTDRSKITQASCCLVVVVIAVHPYECREHTVDGPVLFGVAMGETARPRLSITTTEYGVRCTEYQRPFSLSGTIGLCVCECPLRVCVCVFCLAAACWPGPGPTQRHRKIQKCAMSAAALPALPTLHVGTSRRCHHLCVSVAAPAARSRQQSHCNLCGEAMGGSNFINPSPPSAYQRVACPPSSRVTTATRVPPCSLSVGSPRPLPFPRRLASLLQGRRGLAAGRPEVSDPRSAYY